jgi:uncharacterized protein YPO0396
MELFHQTVSMKAVDNLNDFVRNHMLEPLDTRAQIEALVDHFENLTRAHEAVVKARTQIGLLAPMMSALDGHDEMTDHLAAIDSQIAALPRYFAGRARSSYGAAVAELSIRLAGVENRIASEEARENDLRRAATALTVEVAGAGGDHLSSIEAELSVCETERERRRDKLASFNRLLSSSGLDVVANADQFGWARAAAKRRQDELDQAQADADNRLQEQLYAARELEEQARALNAELTSLRSRPSNLPSQSLELRARLCADLRLDPARLPFAGELMRAREDASEWEGAAERVLHNFALSLLVPGELYPAVAQWIDERHLNARVVYFRVPAATMAGSVAPERRTAHPLLFDMLELKADSSFRTWLENELGRRANHACVDDAADFHLVARAVTRAGQVKDRERHEKDDRHRIDDRRRYVLGWDNRLKLEALISEAQRLQGRQAKVSTLVEKQRTDKASVADQMVSVRSLSAYETWEDLDWERVVNKAAELSAELERILASSDILAGLKEELRQVEERERLVSSELSTLQRDRGGIENELRRARVALEEAQRVLDDPNTQEAADDTVEAIDGLLAKELGPSQLDAATLESAQRRVYEALGQERARLLESRQRLVQRIIAYMSDFRTRYPQETLELDVSMESAGEFRELNRRLTDDDLPRFELSFKDYLNQNTIRDIASFSAQLNKHEKTIRDRIATINESLFGIDYNEGRYIVLVPDQTPNTEIRDFRAELRACTDNIVGGDQDEQYSEQRFLQVKGILDRFKGREGFTDLDRNWTRRVTDVRQWFVFSASERWRDTDIEYEHYSDSAGKSGGQKEKLAYTILAASLAYQFKLDWGASRSKAFRFVVIDEAFNRGSEVSTRYALTPGLPA